MGQAVFNGLLLIVRCPSQLLLMRGHEKKPLKRLWLQARLDTGLKAGVNKSGGLGKRAKR